MTTVTKYSGQEAKIIEAAKSMFIEKGFAETSMSDIAARVGMNRPRLHYYFRTKEKMYQAVFGQIVRSFVPKMQDAILQKDKSVGERVGEMIDAYYAVFLVQPDLPLFALREIERDADAFIGMVKMQQMEMYGSVSKIADSLREEMAQGHLREIPLRAVFFTFYGLLIMPFLTKNLAGSLLLKDDETLEDLLARWKPYVVLQMESLLCVK
ncbi:MAG: TetR/AcrR family transcriptional regulator [Paraprevotella sp.]|nr:TetR/AcrR family transcriptional regulator [Paraprevotella sp.]